MIELYVDSNIFIFAALDTGNLGERCRTILKMIDEGKINCASSYLVIDEVIWIIKKRSGKEDASRIVRAALSLPINWLDINRSTMIGMIEAFADNNLDPRDSLHLSSMRMAGLSTILSEDSDFERIDGIDRLDSISFLKRYGKKE